MTDSLHLLGTDSEDLAIISACLQDAVTCRADMAYLRRERRFALVLNRFRWEGKYAEDEEPERVRTGLHFDTVMKVRLRDIASDGDQPLELLAIRTEKGETGARILFDFAGGGAILLEAECLDCQMHDLTAPWTTRHVPRHAGLAPGDGE